ncbi:MAG: hypothetical protein CMC97_07150 [Flavobacteriales bacterium]|nr:hypothetical protein [Flavobacteriales bacterium]
MTTQQATCGPPFCLGWKSATLMSLINIVYTESLTSAETVRYLITFPGSVGGPVMAVCVSMVSMFAAVTLWILQTYTVAAAVTFGILAVYITIYLTIQGYVKATFTTDPNHKNSRKWTWAFKAETDENSAPSGAQAMMYTHSQIKRIREIACLALQEEKAVQMESVAESVV